VGEEKESGFSDSTRNALEDLAKEHAHRKWLGEILKRYAQWIAAISLGATVAWDIVARIIKEASGR
jgi:hypothetical protein